MAYRGRMNTGRGLLVWPGEEGAGMAKKLFVAGLPYDATEEQIRDEFSGVGNVVSVNVATDRYSGKSRGFAFVEMSTDEEAKQAIAKLDGTMLGGRRISVAESKPREQREGGERPSAGYGPRRGERR